MMINVRRTAAGLAAGAGIAALLVAAGGRSARVFAQTFAPRGATAESTIGKWPAPAQNAARLLMNQYGKPGEFTDLALIWRNSGPWKKTVAYRAPSAEVGGAFERDYVEQFISYGVPAARTAELQAFARGITIEEAFGEIASRGESESANFLALNLADEIVSGKRSAEEARGFYDRTMALAEAGKSSPYLDGFLFHVNNGDGVNP